MGIVAVLAVFLVSAGWKVYEETSLAISATNIRQLSAGSVNYLAENRHVFWPYRTATNGGTAWWFGFESAQSAALPEGQRTFDPTLGPLANYIPAAMRPDPSFKLGAAVFKPKYAFGYLGVGYNVLLGGGWLGTSQRLSDLALGNPGQVVVFSTSAQVNTFQKPASSKNPMIEEFYGFDDGGAPFYNPASIHFRHHGYAMVAFADGSAGFLPMDETTRDLRLPKANVGRFAPAGSTNYLR